MIFQTYLFILYFLNVHISRITAPKKKGNIFPCCTSFPEEEQSHDLRDAPFSSHTELQRSELETIDEDDEPLSMERTAVLTGSSSFSRGQFQFDFECTTSHKRDISEHTLIYEVYTNLIIDDVKQQYDRFVYDTVLQTSLETDSVQGEQKTRMFSLVYNFLQDHLLSTLQNNFPRDTEQIFKGIYVIYIAAEYYYSHILCTLWNETTERDETEKVAMELKRNNILQNCSSVIDIVRNITKAYKRIYRRLLYPDYGSQRSEESSTSCESKSKGKRRMTRTSSSYLRFDYEYDENTSTLDQAMSMLWSFIETMHEVYRKQEKKIVRQRQKFGDEYKVRSNIYHWINKKLQKYLRYLRQYFASLNIEKGLSDYRANIRSYDEKLSISLDEQFMWRNAVKTYQLNHEMNPFEFLSKCEEFRNEVTYYAKGYIHQILPINIRREYRYPEYNLRCHENSFYVVIFPQ